MQPYQEAAEEVKRQGELPLKIAKSIGKGTASAAASYLGGGAINRVLPFLSKYIPENLVKKGLSKIDPRYGKFIDKALSGGKSIENVKDFIGEKIEESSESGQAPKENRNIIQQYSPELHQFMDQQIKQGRSPIEAAAIAQNDKKFSEIIKKLSKDHKSPWSSIVEGVYGGQGQAQSQGQPNQQSDQVNQGADDQAILAAIEKALRL